MIKVLVPTQLQKLTGGKSEVFISECCDILSLIDKLNEDFPGIKNRICDEGGNIRRFVNIFLNGEDIRFLEKEKTKLENECEISIVPAVSGG
ncbi:TPA: molybdopterin synthase sulfur carrier subunit [bacterium]|nr:molybdopterin synthase sulfur carrier subunit [bacterium]